MRWTAADLAAIVDGELFADGGLAVTGVSTDSRAITPGDCFIALTGEQFDGADFAFDAMASGAVLVIAQRRLEQPCIVVRDALDALAAIARDHVASLTDTRVIAITGSSGKTSTKDLVAQVLAHAGPTVAPVGSYNNDIGLPRTALRADADTRFLVLEMGMRGPGQIARLCHIAPPDVAVVLNVGSAHVGETGSREGTAMAKGEILQALHADGVGIINRDDAFASLHRDLVPGRRLEFGIDAGDVHASAVRLDDLARASFTLHVGAETAPVTLRLLGEHHIQNALAAAAIASACGMGVHDIADALSAAESRSRGRMEHAELPNGVTLIDDSYNANPESMRSALRALAAMGRGRRTWAVLGEMRELGAERLVEHDAIGRLAVRLDISHLVAVGPAGKLMHIAAANEGSWGDEAAHVPDAEAAAAYVIERWRPGDIVLVKASRSERLERVAQALRAAAARED